MKTEQRSRIMRAVRSKDTAPELAVRQIAHKLGYRYRLHRRDLPGSPDLTFASRQKAIFIHGCFWHGHDCRRGDRQPKTNSAYWTAKIARNRARDERARGALSATGWKTLTIWECEMKSSDDVARRLRDFLGPPRWTM